MNFFGATQMQLSLSALFTALAIALGLLLWWLVRRKRTRIWLPILRVVHLNAQPLPKLYVTPPPWLAFVCFAACAAALLIYSWRPQVTLFVPATPKQTRVHLFVDLSPSMESVTTMEQMRQSIQRIYDDMKKDAAVSLSFSDSLEILHLTTNLDIDNAFKNKSFHRPGLRLGEAIQEVLKLAEDTNKLVIVSDGDEYSWQDFNWRYFTNELQVFLARPYGSSGKDKTLANVFINTAQYTATPDATQALWDVEIARNLKDSDAANGTITAMQGDKLLAKMDWTIPPKSDRTTARLQWDVTKQQAESEAITWSIAPETADHLLSDNTYRSQTLGNKHDALIIAPVFGEGALDDSTHHLQMSLEVLGFAATRIDKAPTDMATFHTPLVVALGGAGYGKDYFCPRMRTDPRTKTFIWLAPITLERPFDELCSCFATLIGASNEETATPSYCQQLNQRDQWAQVLSSLGAKQIGGEVDNQLGALAWNFSSKKRNIEVLAFTLPIQPLTQTGLTYGTLPKILQSLLMWEGLTDMRTKQHAESWPRYYSITQVLEQLKPDWQSSNVPFGESLIHNVDAANLPPSISVEEVAQYAGQNAQREESDPKPWLLVLSLIAICCALLEGIIGLTQRFRHLFSKSVILLLTVYSVHSNSANAVEIVGVGYPQMEFQRISKDVMSRTSIEMSPTLKDYTAIQNGALAEPWLWLQSPQYIPLSHNTVHPDLQNWLARGGFLVIENVRDFGQLERWFQAGSFGIRAGEGWTPIPPDHELMRSFHLLDTLPACNQMQWRGFNYDNRLAVIAIPYSLVEVMSDQPRPPGCAVNGTPEKFTRIFINIMMVALATDYKKDQIHLPEILKRLR